MMDTGLKELVDQRFTDLQKLMDTRFSTIEDGQKRQESLMTAFVEQLGSVQDRFPTKETIKEMAEKRDIIQSNQEERIKTLEVKVDKHEGRIQRWGGGLAVIVILLGMLEALSIHFKW